MTDFSVDYDVIDNSNIISNHENFMIEHYINQCFSNT